MQCKIEALVIKIGQANPALSSVTTKPPLCKYNGYNGIEF